MQNQSLLITDSMWIKSFCPVLFANWFFFSLVHSANTALKTFVRVYARPREKMKHAINGKIMHCKLWKCPKAEISEHNGSVRSGSELRKTTKWIDDWWHNMKSVDMHINLTPLPKYVSRWCFIEVVETFLNHGPFSSCYVILIIPKSTSKKYFPWSWKRMAQASKEKSISSTWPSRTSPCFSFVLKIVITCRVIKYDFVLFSFIVRRSSGNVSETINLFLYTKLFAITPRNG